MSREWTDYDGSTPVKMLHGFTLYLRSQCEYSRKRFIYRVAERNELDWLERQNLEGMICFDVGANIGYISCFLLKKIGKGQIHAFEPDPITYKILKRNIELNASSQQQHRCWNCALGRKVGQVNLFINDNYSGDNRTYDTEDKRVTLKVPCLSIDAYVNQEKIGNIDLLKIDVQGAEIEVLLGAISSIQRFDPIIYIEWDPHCHSSFLSFATQFFEFGKTMSWKYRIIENNELREIDLATLKGDYVGNLIIPGAHSDRFRQ